MSQALQPHARGPPGREPEAERRSVELTILMPCLNEAETIDTCIAKACEFLARSGVAGEILIADNGSTDGSVEFTLARGARVIAVAERGYGAPLRAGRPFRLGFLSQPSNELSPRPRTDAARRISAAACLN